VIKKTGERELFDREKLARGIYRACEKRPLEAARIEDVVNQIEREIFGRGEAEIPSEVIGLLTMQALSDLDEVAYVRFASVYRSFTSAESFRREVAQLKRTQSRDS